MLVYKQSIPSYLLHGSDTGKGTSKHCQVLHKSPHMLADTGLCCPIWVCPLPPPSPSSPGPHERGSGHPVLGLETSASASWWRLINSGTEIITVAVESPFCYFSAKRQYCVLATTISSVDCLSLSPLLRLCFLGRGTEIFTVTYGT